MGRNVDLVKMCGLPTEIEYKSKKYNVRDQLEDYDIDDEDTNPEEGIWNLTLGLPDDTCIDVTFKCGGTVQKIELNKAK